MICCKTVIGFGSPNKSGSHDCHGAPLGDDEITATRNFLDWSDETRFAIPEDIYAQWDKKEQGKKDNLNWSEKFSAYQSQYPALAAEFTRRVIEGELPVDFDQKANDYIQLCQNTGESIE